MVAPLTLVLPFLTTLHVSQGIPLPQQGKERPEEFLIPLTEISSDSLVRLPDQNNPLFQFSGYPSYPYQTSMIIPSPGIPASTQEAKYQLLQMPVNEIIERFQLDGSVLSSPLSVSVPHDKGESVSTVSKSIASLNPTFQLTSQNSQSFPIQTVLQPSSMSSVAIPPTSVSNAYFNSKNNGLLGSAMQISTQTLTQNPSMSSKNPQSALRPDATFSDTVLTRFPNMKVVPPVPNRVNLVLNSELLQSLSGAVAPGSSISNKIANPTLSAPNYGKLQAIVHDIASSVSGAAVPATNNPAANLQASIVQPQSIQLPCMLHIQSPLAITMNPGTSQSSPFQQIQQSIIPSSFIDHSPPTIAILRPPSFLAESENSPVAAPTPTTYAFTHDDDTSDQFVTQPNVAASSFPATFTKQKARSQDSHGVTSQNDEVAPSESETEPASGMARNGFPIAYAVLPTSSLPSSFVSGAAGAIPPVKTNPKSQSAPTTRPSQGKNPFFSVNKRKHFEYYQYF